MRQTCLTNSLEVKAQTRKLCMAHHIWPAIKRMNIFLFTDLHSQIAKCSLAYQLEVQCKIYKVSNALDGSSPQTQATSTARTSCRRYAATLVTSVIYAVHRLPQSDRKVHSA